MCKWWYACVTHLCEHRSQCVFAVVSEVCHSSSLHLLTHRLNFCLPSWDAAAETHQLHTHTHTPGSASRTCVCVSVRESVWVTSVRSCSAAGFRLPSHDSKEKSRNRVQGWWTTVCCTTHINNMCISPYEADIYSLKMLYSLYTTGNNSQYYKCS